jgi:hypothetical protein
MNEEMTNYVEKYWNEHHWKNVERKMWKWNVEIGWIELNESDFENQNLPTN